MQRGSDRLRDVPNPADDLISAVRSFRYMLLKKAIDYGSSQSRNKWRFLNVCAKG